MMPELDSHYNVQTFTINYKIISTIFTVTPTKNTWPSTVEAFKSYRNFKTLIYCPFLILILKIQAKVLFFRIYFLMIYLFKVFAIISNNSLNK